MPSSTLDAHYFMPPHFTQTLRDLVTETAGEAAAAQLISALVTDQLESASGGTGGYATAGIEAVAGLLQRSCPGYFKEADRAFYQVRWG